MTMVQRSSLMYEQSYVGSAMTTIFVCDDQKAKYNYGMCAKSNEQKRAQFSLWFAYAVDVAGDLAGPYPIPNDQGIVLTSAVMFLPFRMTWNLRLPRAQKLGIFVLFGSGWICIVGTKWRNSSRIHTSVLTPLLLGLRHASCCSSQRQRWTAKDPRSKVAANVDYHRDFHGLVGS